MMKRIKAAAAALIVAYISIPGLRDLGSAIEGHLFPVRGAQSISTVARGSDGLCWVWTSDKLRPIPAIDLDVKLFDATGEMSIVAPFRPDTLRPWRFGGAASVGVGVQPWCVKLPAWIRPNHWVRVEQRITYQSPVGPWTLQTVIPSVEHPGF